MKILSLSDVEVGFIYSPAVKKYFEDVDLVIGCGDLSYYYLEYIISNLDIPLYFVRGNHARAVEYGCSSQRNHPWGGVDLHCRAIKDEKGVIMAGIEGCIRYNRGPYQYTPSEMWWMVWKLVPSFFANKTMYGRFLDIFVTHAPLWGIHDRDDLPHQGIKAFNWLVKVFQPIIHLHGHIHIYFPNETTVSRVDKTLVVNTYGYRLTSIDLSSREGTVI